MSFSWKGLLGVGGAASAGTSTNAIAGGLTGSIDPFGGISGFDEKDFQWETENVADQPNMLGMRNFGNTCYVNSVIQALYYCKPFRESLLAYTSSDSQDTSMSKEQLQGSLSKGTSVTQRQQELLDEITFFNAFRNLFSQMVSATVTPALPEPTPASSPPVSTSYLASGLSRKGTSKAASNINKSNIPASASMPTTMLAPGFSAILPLPPSPASASNAKKVINSISNVVVEDDDIKKFLTSLKKSNLLFDSTAHQDAHELLNFVLNRIGEDVVEEVKARKGKMAGANEVEAATSPVSVMDIDEEGRTWVHRVFEGILTNETRCLTCETVTSRDECFLDLSIDIERNSSVTSCLRQFSASEMLCSRNKFFCDTCSGLQEAEKRMKVKKLPNVLALHLKRFKYEESVQRYVKLAYRVVFPFELRLFNTSDDAEDPDKLYELFGIIVHIGMGPHHGHYIAIVKVGTRWFVFDDETINIIDEADISRYFGDTPGAGSAYVLFYQAVELNMQELGLIDTKAEKQRAKEKMEENLWEQYRIKKMSSTSGFQDTGLKIDTRKIPIVVASPGQASPTSPDVSMSDFKSTAMASSMSSSGTSSTSPAAFFKRGQSIASPSSTQAASTTDQQSEGKSGSWFSSLRPGSARKASANNLLSVVSPTSSTGAGLPTFKQQAPTSEMTEDEETASISTNGSLRQGNRDTIPISRTEAAIQQPSRGGLAATGHSDVVNTAFLDTPASLPSSLQNSPSKGSAKQQQHQILAQQGAAFAPAERPLSKKEQEKIARQSRRSSWSIPQTVPLHTTPPPLSSSNGNQASLGMGQPSATSTTTSNGNGNIGNANTLGRKPIVRRPSTADPQLDQGTTARRRSTLSKTFGFGRKNDKQ